MEAILVYLLIALIVYQFKVVFTKDYAAVWSPITIISLCYIYYCIIPYFTGGSEHYNLGGNSNLMFWITADLSYISVLFGFSRPSKKDFDDWNRTFSEKNLLSASVLVFFVAFLGYSSFRGVHFTFVAEESVGDLIHTSFEHYFIELALLYIFSFGLMILCFKKKVQKKWLWFLFYYIIVSCLFAGTRSRIVYIALTSMIVYYVYPRPRRPNYPILAVLAGAMFVLFSVMEYSRLYSQGIRMDRVSEMSRADMTKGAEENNSVYWFSSLVTERYEQTSEYVYFEPIATAVLMPIPRAIFPWKPNGQYLIDTQNLCIGSSEGGAAFLYFTEGFLSLSWFGVIFYGWFLGWLSRRFWDNYRRNPDSIGATIACAVYTAMCYGFISRGYLASSLEMFVYAICLPFWIVKLAGKFFPIFRP